MRTPFSLQLYALVLAAALACPSAHAQQAQANDPDDAQSIPFELPAEVIAAGDGVEDQQGELWALLDATPEACAEHFSEMYRQGEPLQDGWRISGFGTGPDARQRRRWRYGVITEDGTLRQLTVTDDNGQCRVALSTDAMTIRSDRFRWPWPELVVPPGSTQTGQVIPLDTLLQDP